MVLGMLACAAVISCASPRSSLTADGGGPTGAEDSLAFPVSTDADHPPTADFHSYAKAGWLDEARPDARDLLDAMNHDALEASAAQLDALAAQPRAEPELQGLVRAYQSFLDEEAMERQRLRPIADDLSAIARISTRDEAAREAARSVALGVRSLVAVSVGPGPEDPDAPALYLAADGLTFHPDLYLSDAPAAAALRAAYLEHIERLLALARTPEPDPTSTSSGAIPWRKREPERDVRPDAATAAAAAAGVVLIETEIARGLAAESDPSQTPVFVTSTVEEVFASAPGFAWEEFFDALGVPRSATVVVRDPAQVASVARAFGTAPREAWRGYLAYHRIAGFAPFLPPEIRDAQAAFERAASAAPPPSPRARVIAYLNAGLPEAMGVVYERATSGSNVAARARRVADAVRQAMAERVNNAGWLTPETASAAAGKIAAAELIIAPSPAQPGAVADRRLPRAAAAVNARTLALAAHAREMAALASGRPPQTLLAPPQSAEAYYDPAVNAVVVTAAAARPPLLSPGVDPTLDYAAFGGLVGRLLAAAVDDRGRFYGPDGAAGDWWSDDDVTAWEEVLAGLSEDEAEARARLALLNGLAAAHDAYVASAEDRDDKRFFLEWARATGAIDAADPAAAERINSVLALFEPWRAVYGLDASASAPEPPESGEEQAERSAEPASAG
jgi:predicted metalloendopeptidase